MIIDCITEIAKRTGTADKFACELHDNWPQVEHALQVRAWQSTTISDLKATVTRIWQEEQSKEGE